MRTTLAICIFMHFIGSASAAEPLSAPDQKEAERHLVANWAAEKMIEAAVQTNDANELQSQVFRLAREIGGSASGAASRGAKNCYRATSMLMNVAMDLKRSVEDGMTASHLVSLRYSYREWTSSISACEADLGQKKRKRLLVLSLGG